MQKVAIIKALRLHFSLIILLDLIGLARRIFFYRLKLKRDENAAILREITEINHQMRGFTTIVALHLN